MSKTRRGRGEGSLEQLPSGSWRAVVSRTVNGRRVRSSKTFPLKADAVRWRDKQREAGPAAAGTLGDWLTVWLDLHRANVSPSNFKTDDQTVRRHVRPGLGSLRLRDVTGLAVEQWLARLKADGISQSERHKAGRTARKLLTAAAEKGQIPACPRFKVPRRPEPKTHALTREELRKVTDAAAALGHGAMFLLWADAGPRPGEVFGLDRGDFDGPACRVSFRRVVCVVTGALKDLKTRRSRRTIDLAPRTAAAVALHLAALPPGRATDPLFPSASGCRWSYGGFRHHFERLRTAAGVRMTPYTMRHTCASLLLQNGVNIKVVSERLGHEDISTTLRCYIHVMPGEQRIAAAKMGELLYGSGVPSESHGGPVNGSSDVT